MFRKGLIDILKERPLTLQEMTLLLDGRPRELEDDLQHPFRSLRNDTLCGQQAGNRYADEFITFPNWLSSASTANHF